MNVAPVRRRFLFVYVSTVCDDLVLHVYAWVWQLALRAFFLLVCSLGNSGGEEMEAPTDHADGQTHGGYAAAMTDERHMGVVSWQEIYADRRHHGVASPQRYTGAENFQFFLVYIR